MRSEDVEGALGPHVTLEDARYRLALVHLEESLAGGRSGIRFVVVDGDEILLFDMGVRPSLPTGDYEWRA